MTPSVIQLVLSLEPGGTERLVLELCRRLQPAYAPHVVCLDAPGAWAQELAGLGVGVTAVGRQPGFDVGVSARIARVIRQQRATVVHCHHYSPFVYGRLAALQAGGVRVVFTEHGRLADGRISAKRRLATRVLVRGVRDMFAVSHELREDLLSQGFPDRMGVIWNGIDPGPPPEAAGRARARALLGIPDGVPVIGTIARLDPVKDLATLVRATAVARDQLPATRLVIVGDGPERPALVEAARAAGLGDALMLAGHRNDARTLLPGFDVHASSSTSEGISLTLLEAMAAERAIVATAVGGTPEVVIDGQTGALVPSRDPQAMGQQLARLLGDVTRAHALGRSGRARVLAHFTIERMVARYAEVYARA